MTEVERSIRKLKSEANQSVPFRTRKMARKTLNDGTTSTSINVGGSKFDFTEIFDELSALSKDISKSLETDDSETPVTKQSEAKDISLRHIAFMNNVKKASKESNAGHLVSSTKSSADRLQDIKNLDAKLAAIRSDLEGTEY
jgi:hypothetical protein